MKWILKLFFLWTKNKKAIISDLENQIQLKESLLQKYILIVKDKDTQINQLINVSLLCNQQDSVTPQKKIRFYF